jgi:cyanobactin maturation PatA/PatG family protease
MSDVAASGCGCAACAGAQPAQRVFAIGALGYDYGTEARRDSIKQHMAVMPHPTEEGELWGDGANPHEPAHLLAYLDKHPWDAASVIWTLNIETTPIYAVAAAGPFAHACCERLRQYLREQLGGVERVSVPGLIVGQTRLQNGHIVPVVRPELRGMYNWKTAALVEANLGRRPAASAPATEREAYERRERGLRNFLERVYHELRNLGQTAPERAVNFAATQTFEAANVYTHLDHPMELDKIEAERSPLCRPDSDCWDVKLIFFNPESQVQTVRKVYRMTIDVSDVVPVTLGRTREWFVR